MRRETTNAFLLYLNVYRVVRMYLNEVKNNYYIYRSCFIRQLNLSETFHFDAYLKRAMKGTFTEWAQIHWSVLAFVLVAQLAIWMAFATVLPKQNGIPYIVLTIICSMSFFVLHMKIEMVYTYLRDHPEIWILPDSNRYEIERESFDNALDREDSEMESFPRGLNGRGDNLECEINLASQSAPDFHLRVHESSSDSESDSAEHRNERKQHDLHRKQTKPAFAHYSSSSDSPFSTSSWVSTWSSISSWESDGENKRHYHHHHHHHHHHQAHHKKHHHQSDLLWISGCLIPFLCCKIGPRDVKTYFTPTLHQRNFWLGSPGFFLYLCHLSTFWQATVIALIIGSLFGFLTIPVYFKVIAIILSLINLLYFFPFIVYRYSFCMNVGEFSKQEFVREVHEKPNRPSRKTKETKEKNISRSNSMNSQNSQDLNRSSSSPRSNISMSELRENQDENLKKILPAHPRLRRLQDLSRPREDSLGTLVNATPPSYSSSSSSESI